MPDLRHSLGVFFWGVLAIISFLSQKALAIIVGYSESSPQVVQAFDRQHATPEASWLSALLEFMVSGRAPTNDSGLMAGALRFRRRGTREARAFAAKGRKAHVKRSFKAASKQ